MNKKIIMLVVAGVMTFATSVVEAGGWTLASKVEVVYLHKHHGGYGVFQLGDMSYNSDNCSNMTYYVVSKQNNPVFEEIYSLLLAAHVSGTKVKLWVSGCSPHNHPEIQHAKTFK